jgi:hypothetical protein
MALLARSIGIPTRVVAGYRVFEYNPLGGYAVVRQRNAHTWVEAWTPDDGWLTYEPTPATGFFEEMPTRTPLFSAALDMAAVMLRYLGRRAAALTLGQIALGAGVLLAAWTAMVLLRRLRRRDKKAIPDFRSYAAPPESIVRLMTALAAAGHCRHDSEPIDRYTTRVAATMLSRDSGGVLVRLIDDYNQWRFAGRGDVRALAARIDAWIDTMPSRGSGAG